MKVKEAQKILNVSRATVHNWIKTGKLKLNKVLTNGYIDINDESVYDCIVSTYEPLEKKNRIVIFTKDGDILKFGPDDETTRKVSEYLDELTKANN